MNRTIPLFSLGLSLFLLATSLLNFARADVILDWNKTASDVFLADTTYQNPGMASRSMAMVNLAMYDAVNGIQPTHQQMFSHSVPTIGASVEAAAAQAAYRVLSEVYPGQQSMLASQLNSSLASLPAGQSRTDGVAFGDLVANNIVNMRATDGFSNIVPYMPQVGAGLWEPDPLNPDQQAWGPEWGHVATFAIPDTNQFMPDPMPELTSQEYADAFNEVKLLGARNSTTRTADQTEAALFWAYDRLGMGTPMRMFNGIMRTVATNEGNDLHENARMFAMASTAIADAGITAWDSKFIFDFWRPISGIRRADEDGNPATSKDEAWEPLGAPGGIAPDGSTIDDFTPPFPTYLSGHASFGGAFFKTLENFYGTDEIGFDVTSDEVPGAIRSFSSFSEANEENGRSRVYLGIHWNFDDTDARLMGAETANYIYANHFQAVPEPSSVWLLGIGMLCLCRRGSKP